MRQALRAEMLDRAVQVNREGLRAVIPRLHHSTSCDADTITVETSVEVDADCSEGLILVPSLFITDRVQCTTSDHWTPAICYPASGRYLWAAPPTPRSLERLLGTTRSRILAALTTPMQTTDVHSWTRPRRDHEWWGTRPTPGRTDLKHEGETP